MPKVLASFCDAFWSHRDLLLPSHVCLSVLTWSGFCLYAGTYNKEGVGRVLRKLLGDRASARCMCILPPTLSPASQRAWLRVLRFEFLSER